MPRQLYGGWATAVTPQSTYASTGWDADGAQYYKDTKWASMAEKYALDPAERDLASHIRVLSKDVLKNKRAAAKAGDLTAASWLAGYNRAAKNIRSKMRLPHISWQNKESVWNTFKDLAWNDDYDDGTKAWFALASRAPYISAPAIEGVAPAEAARFVAASNAYELPSKLSVDTRRLLSLARRGRAISPQTLESGLTATQQAVYNAAVANGASPQAATIIANTVGQTWNQARVPAAPVPQ